MYSSVTRIALISELDKSALVKFHVVPRLEDANTPEREPANRFEPFVTRVYIQESVRPILHEFHRVEKSLQQNTPLTRVPAKILSPLISRDWISKSDKPSLNCDHDLPL